eukprot:Sspe_Gene.53928::Locus_29789_Transcript_1_1_Confidence_1.000_Length_419::g.53928::m.53928
MREVSNSVYKQLHPPPSPLLPPFSLQRIYAFLAGSTPGLPHTHLELSTTACKFHSLCPSTSAIPTTELACSLQLASFQMLGSGSTHLCVPLENEVGPNPCA